jgi:hypothetical protein
MGDEIKEFATAIGAREPIPGDGKYNLFRQLFRRSNYFILDGKFAIIKISRSEIPFWGVGKDFIDLLNHTENYFLILLISNKEGWFFTKPEVNNNINSGRWRHREADNNYKINMPLPDANSFIGPSHFLRKVALGQSEMD